MRLKAHSTRAGGRKARGFSLELGGILPNSALCRIPSPIAEPIRLQPRGIGRWIGLAGITLPLEVPHIPRLPEFISIESPVNHVLRGNWSPKARSSKTVEEHELSLRLKSAKFTQSQAILLSLSNLKSSSVLWFCFKSEFSPRLVQF